MATATRVGSWLPALALVVGCASRFPPCPASGGPSWRELASEHFLLTTDLDRDAALETLAALEELRGALVACIAASPDVPTGRLPIIVLDHGWNEVASQNIGGFFGQSVLYRPLVVMQAGSALAQESVIKHELVHFFSRKVIPVQPRWFAEGLATYFQTIEYDGAAGRITVGRPPADMLRIVQRGALADVGDLFAATEIRQGDRLPFYPTAWLAMHYLMNHRHAALVAYEVALARGALAKDAWAQAFPDLPADKLEVELRSYLNGGQYELLVYPFKAPATRIVAERTLTDADAHAVRALLLAASSRDPGLHRSPVSATEMQVRAEQEAGEALREAPGHLIAQAVRTWLLGDAVDLELARATARAHPDEWLAWLLVARGLADRGWTEGLEEARRRAASLAAADPAVTLR